MFCNRCGKQMEESNQYCGNCGGSNVQQALPMQAVETNFNFCRSCGAPVSGRYCEQCGESSVKVEAKVKNSFMRMEQLKQTGAAVKNALPGKEALKDMKLDRLHIEKLTTAETIKWAKQGLMFAVIVAIIGLVISTLLAMGLREAIFEDNFNGYATATSLQKNAFETVVNLKLMSYNFLFGGKIHWSIGMGGIKGNVAIILPFVGLVFGVLIMSISEQIRLKISGIERTLLGNGIMAAITGVIGTIAGLLFNKSMRVDINELYGYGYGYSYGSKSADDIVKASSNMNLFFTFFIIFVVTYFTLQIVMKNKDASGKQNPILATIRKIFFTVTGFALVMATSIVVRIFMEIEDKPEGSGWIIALVGILYLTGFLLSMLLTGKFQMVEVIMNSDSALKLKMSLAHVKYEMYGMEDQTDNFMKWWLVIATIIVVCMIVSAAYQFFKGRDLDMKTALRESALVSVGLGVGFALVAKMAGYVMELGLQGTNSYYREMLDLEKGKYSFILKSGSSSLIKTTLVIAIIMCILFAVMYWLVNCKLPVVDTLMGMLKPVVTWVCIGVLCIIFLFKFDPYDINYSIMGIAEDAAEFIGEEIQNNFLDMLDF